MAKYKSTKEQGRRQSGMSDSFDILIKLDCLTGDSTQCKTQHSNGKCDVPLQVH